VGRRTLNRVCRRSCRHATLRRDSEPRCKEAASPKPKRFQCRFGHHDRFILASVSNRSKPVLTFVVRPAGCSESIRDHSQNHKHTVAVIPARYASTRFPGKALADIAGRPMIEHVYRRAEAAQHVDAVIVATDDSRIADAVARFGGNVRMTRSSHSTGTERIAEVAATLDCDLVVNLQGDEPLIEPAAIDEAIQPFAGSETLTMTSLCQRFRAAEEILDPHIVKVVTDRHGFALYFSRAPIPFLRNQLVFPSAKAGPFKHIGLYVQRREFLLTVASLEPTPLERTEGLEQLRVLESGFRIRMLETSHDSIGVDTPDDLERVRRLLTADARA
jgi:3-deoxy-manno-octulosonate cytidylyltransferase (CMP-KDO synthetase)